MKGNNKKKLNIISKLIILTLTSILLIFFSIFALVQSFTPKKEKEISYSETSNVNYKVYLKENNFYETEYLEGDMLYVASLIDKINLDFSYTFSIDEPLTMNFEYSIIGKLVVSDESGVKDYYKKSYELMKAKSAKMTNSDKLLIQEKIDIDYNLYNDLVNEFRSTYGLNVNSRLEVYMLVTKINGDNSVVQVENVNNHMTFTIPLSEKAVNIKMDFKELEEASYVILESNAVINDKYLFVVACITIFISLSVVAKWIKILGRLLKKRNTFDKFVSKILREYDRLIVETTNPPKNGDYNIINIIKFDELVDVHDNLNLPIMYYCAKERRKAYFYILHENTVYLYIVNSSSVGVKNNEKK